MKSNSALSLDKYVNLSEMSRGHQLNSDHPTEMNQDKLPTQHIDCDPSNMKLQMKLSCNNIHNAVTTFSTRTGTPSAFRPIVSNKEKAAISPHVINPETFVNVTASALVNGCDSQHVTVVDSALAQATVQHPSHPEAPAQLPLAHSSHYFQEPNSSSPSSSSSVPPHSRSKAITPTPASRKVENTISKSGNPLRNAAIRPRPASAVIPEKLHVQLLLPQNISPRTTTNQHQPPLEGPPQYHQVIQQQQNMKKQQKQMSKQQIVNHQTTMKQILQPSLPQQMSEMDPSTSHSSNSINSYRLQSATNNDSNIFSPTQYVDKSLSVMTAVAVPPKVCPVPIPPTMVQVNNFISTDTTRSQPPQQKRTSVILPMSKEMNIQKLTHNVVTSSMSTDVPSCHVNNEVEEMESVMSSSPNLSVSGKCSVTSKERRFLRLGEQNDKISKLETELQVEKARRLQVENALYATSEKAKQATQTLAECQNTLARFHHQQQQQQQSVQCRCQQNSHLNKCHAAVQTVETQVVQASVGVFELQETISLLQQRLQQEQASFESQREQWLKEKMKVIEYQKQLQQTHAQLSQRNHYLQEEIYRLQRNLLMEEEGIAKEKAPNLLHAIHRQERLRHHSLSGPVIKNNFNATTIHSSTNSNIISNTNSSSSSTIVSSRHSSPEKHPRPSLSRTSTLEECQEQSSVKDKNSTVSTPNTSNNNTKSHPNTPFDFSLSSRRAPEETAC